MKLARFVHQNKIVHGAVSNDLTHARLIAGDPLGEHVVTDDVVRIDRLLAPIVPTDILCIGLNYARHAAESGSAPPPVPMLFIKASGALNAHMGEIPLPANSSMVDYEAELCVVIGKSARHVSVERALDYVYGYTIANDISARDWQRDKNLGGGQFARGKSFDGFCPIGPWVVTRDEIIDPNALAISCTLNGQIVQQSNTADMIHDVAHIVSSLSKTLTLRRGAVILTGTPEGVGMARTPPLWLKDGDEIHVDIERIGRLSNHVRAERT